jgi:preprotein translocase subunit YajC
MINFMGAAVAAIPDTAAAGAAGQQQGGGISMMIFLGIFFVVFYLLFIRPQSKRAKEHKNMIGALAKGDEVVTNGGLAGKINEVEEDFIVLEIAKNLSVSVQKMAIMRNLPKGTLKAL